MIWIPVTLLLAAIWCAEHFRAKAVFWETECRWWEHQASAMEKELKTLKPSERDGKIAMFNGSARV